MTFSRRCPAPNSRPSHALKRLRGPAPSRAGLALFEVNQGPHAIRDTCDQIHSDLVEAVVTVPDQYEGPNRFTIGLQWQGTHRTVAVHAQQLLMRLGGQLVLTGARRQDDYLALVEAFLHGKFELPDLRHAPIELQLMRN